MIGSFRTSLARVLGRRRAERTLSPAEGYDRWAASYRSRMNPLQKLEEQALMRLLPDLRGKTVLDVGCGTGRLSRMAIERGASSTFGADLSSAMLDEAKNQGPESARWILADACALPFDASSFDAAVCTLVLGHIERFEIALAEMNRVVRQGGSIVISDFHPFATLRDWERTFCDPASGRSYAIAQHVHLFEDYFRFFREHGWTIEQFEEPLYEGFPAVFVVRVRKEVQA